MVLQPPPSETRARRISYDDYGDDGDDDECENGRREMRGGGTVKGFCVSNLLDKPAGGTHTGTTEVGCQFSVYSLPCPVFYSQTDSSAEKKPSQTRRCSGHG